MKDFKCKVAENKKLPTREHKQYSKIILQPTTISISSRQYIFCEQISKCLEPCYNIMSLYLID